VFISLLTLTNRTDEEMEKLRAVERLADDGGCIIVTAAITLIEVLASAMTAEQEAAFQALLQRSNVTAVTVTTRIAMIAREIREYYHRLGSNIAVPDSIHLATAVQYEVTALHTYDGCGAKRKRPTDLLKLALPLIEKYPISVTIPEPPPATVDEQKLLPAPTSGSLFGDPDDPRE
jgi:predicted nucleic acid-binding protein